MALSLRAVAALLGEVDDMTALRPATPLYNQRGQSDEDFLSGFVARKDELELLLNGLRSALRGGASEHQLIVGQRGMGKSMLLRAMAASIKSDDALHGALLPLQFREEQYNVNALDVFWRNCAEALAQWCEDNEREDLARRLDRQVESPEWRDAETAAQDFLAACEELGQRAILLVDNLDLILDALKPQERWALRRVLQMPRGPILIGAATHFLEQSGDREAAFYEFFHPHVLDPLSESEMTRCLRALADRGGEAGAAVKTVLDDEPGRLRALFELTGGNPRVLVLIYQLLERRESGDVFADLEALLDQVSPYYKARVEEYATPQQRAVIDAIALNWDPISSHDLSARAGIEVTTVSTHLNRLRRDGFVEEVQSSGARAGYQIAERFLNIWYLMRHGTRGTKRGLQALAEFFGKIYSLTELEQLAALASDRHASGPWHPHFREAIIFSYGQIASETRLRNGDFHAKFPLLPARTNIEALGDGKITSPSTDGDGSAIPIAIFQFEKAMNSVSSGDFEHALKSFEETLSHHELSDFAGIGALFAAAMAGRAYTLATLGRWDEALLAYDAVDARFGSNGDAIIRELVVKSLCYKGSALAGLGRAEEALDTYAIVEARFGATQENPIREAVGLALLNKGGVLGTLGRYDEVIAVCDAVVSRYGVDDDTVFRETVTKAFYLRCLSLSSLGRVDEAIESFNAFEDQVRRVSEPVVIELMPRALVFKGGLLAKIGRHTEAISAFKSVDTRFGHRDQASVRAAVAEALFNAAFALATLARYDEAIATYDDVFVRFGEDSAIGVRQHAAAAHFNKGALMGVLGRHEEAIVANDAFDNHFGASNEPIFRELTARSAYLKGVSLFLLGRVGEAIAAYEALDVRFGASGEPAILERVSSALTHAGDHFSDFVGDLALAESAYRRAVAINPKNRFASASLAWLLLAATRVSEAIALRSALDGVGAVELSLIDAGLAVANDNFGSATGLLAAALEIGLQKDGASIFNDLLRLLRLAQARGYGERLIAWFEGSGNAVKYAPVHAAFIAFVRGERFLRDVNPEVRRPAQGLFDKLSAPRRHATGGAPASPQKATRGRRRKA